MEPTDAIFSFLQDPVNLATAHDVRDWLKDVERRIFETFWRYVRELLEEGLAERHCQARWQVVASASLFEGTNSYIEIAPRRSAQEGSSDNEQFYSIAAEQMGEPAKGSCYFGIYRGARRDEQLDNSLKADGFRPGATWSGYRYFTSLSLPAFRLDRDSVTRMNADNQSNERLVARTVAAQLLQLFEKYHVLLEQLNG